jgi:hypothetical protein
MSECTKWRPLAMKGICECGKRLWQHSDAVIAAARQADLERIAKSST